MRIRAANAFQTVHTAGGLLPADLLQRVAAGDPQLEGLTANDYHLDQGERITERTSRAWTRLTRAWVTFDQARHALPADDHATTLTRERWLLPLFEELGYGRLIQQPAITLENRTFPIFSAWQHTPIHLVGAGVSLDQRTAGVRGAAGQSPHSLMQELLNRSPQRLWGIVSNGLQLRVVRDNVTLTRQAYVQFDLEAILTGELYPDFVLLWLTCHQSRVEADQPAECWLERWTRRAASDGVPALGRLRAGVKDAIETLGAGFLANPANHHLHRQLRDGELHPAGYYHALLHLVYRLLFLFVAEDRDTLLDRSAPELARERYRNHYSTAHLRDLADQRRGDRHHDRYEQLKLVMRALHQDGCAPLALPALGSYLWHPDAIDPLNEATLANEHLLTAIRLLARVQQDGVRRSVDFRNLGAEELGSIYESLLELHPELNRDTGTFKLATVSGSQRKTSGSYYTPTPLIRSLLDSALDPVLDQAAHTPDPEHATLALSVIDPACGSGHFLIAAANRIAKRLAAIRTDEGEPSPAAVQRALRDVVGHCIYGVDVNPMAVELCKISLWMTALEPGRPLSFLDHRIVCGNSLLGSTPELIAQGIPDTAFKPITGDDKKAVSALRKDNRKQQAGQLTLDTTGDRLEADIHTLAAQTAALTHIDDRTLSGVHAQQQRYRALEASVERDRAKLAADTWCAAFVAAKQPGATPITQDTVYRALNHGTDGLSAAEREVIAGAAAEYRFLHLHIAFPDIHERGGFDVVLGNPPWERVKLQEKEFFAARSEKIAGAPNKAARNKLINALQTDDPDLHQAFEVAKREAEGESHLIRDSGRYPLCGRGDVNTYAIFAELMRNTISPTGRAGLIVPTGIATDDTYKLFFSNLVERQMLASLLGFYDRKQIFTGADVHAFCLLTLTGAERRVVEPEFVFMARNVEDLDDPERRFTLTAADIALLNPNTRTCPVFRTRRDAELTKQIYRRVPVLIREGDPNGNPWGIRFSTMFHMSNDSHLFHTRAQLEAAGATLHGNTFTRGNERWLPLYEAKMLHHYDHRWATYDGTDTRDLTETEKADPTFLAFPRYWVADGDVEAALEVPDSSWLLAFRNVARITDERTFITTPLPAVAVGNSAPVLMLQDPSLASCLTAVWTSYACDYTTRQKLGGVNMNFLYVYQLAVPEPARFISHHLAFVRARVLELTYTAYDLAGFAADLGYAGLPFRWDTERRALIRAELDALMFRLYGIERADVEYIMGTFPIVKRRDEQRFGEYRTKRLILERYDAMAAADADGIPYETPLDPPPGDPRAAHTVPEPAAAVS